MPYSSRFGFFALLILVQATWSCGSHQVATKLTGPSGTKQASGGQDGGPGRNSGRSPSRDRILVEWARMRQNVSRMAYTLNDIALDGIADDWRGAYWSRGEIVSPGSGETVRVHFAIAPRQSELFLWMDVAEWTRADIQHEGSGSGLGALKGGDDRVG